MHVEHTIHTLYDLMKAAESIFEDASAEAACRGEIPPGTTEISINGASSPLCLLAHSESLSDGSLVYNVNVCSLKDRSNVTHDDHGRQADAIADALARKSSHPALWNLYRKAAYDALVRVACGLPSQPEPVTGPDPRD